MKSKEIKKGQKMVFLEWVDASMWGTDQTSREKAENYGLSHGFVCGFLVKEDKQKRFTSPTFTVKN